MSDYYHRVTDYGKGKDAVLRRLRDIAESTPNSRIGPSQLDITKAKLALDLLQESDWLADAKPEGETTEDDA